MSGFRSKGWCPDAWRPMMAGDGLLVRIKPRLGRLLRDEVLALCEAAATWGNGQVDVTRRANLQIRGVKEGDWPLLLERLVALELVDVAPGLEKRRNLLVAPDWQVGDDTYRIASQLLDRLDELPDLPAKAGFVVDAGPASVLAEEPGDFRIERDGSGGLILRGEGRPCGIHVAAGAEVDALIALARWFASSGGAAAGRMARHRAELPAALAGTRLPARSAATIAPGTHALGAAYGVPFGRLDARTLAAAVKSRSVVALRVTPWRVLLFEDALFVPIEGLIDDAADPLLRVDACPGVPACPEASVETRALARRLAPFIAGHLHVSGCAKACACSRAADVTLTGRAGLYDLAFNARAGSPPARSALGEAELLAEFGAD